MGQFITVTVRPGASASVRIFDLNRSLTGMAIERYPSIDAVKDGGDRAPDVLARRLFDLLQNTIELLLGPDQRVDVLDRPDLRVLDRGRLGHRRQRLARRIRDQMEMKVARQHVGHLWKNP